MWPNEPSLLSIQMHNSMLSKPLTPSKNSFCRNDIHFLDLTAIKAEISVISVPVCVSKPEASMSLISTRKRSSGIWASVWRNTVPIFFTPTFIYNAAMSLCRQGLQQTQSREKKTSQIIQNRCVMIYNRVLHVEVHIYFEVIDSITFTQRDLENLQHAEESSQSTQALLPTPTNSNQQGITIGGLQYTTDATPGYKHRTDGVFLACGLHLLCKFFFVHVSLCLCVSLTHAGSLLQTVPSPWQRATHYSALEHQPMSSGASPSLKPDKKGEIKQINLSLLRKASTNLCLRGKFHIQWN